MWRFRTAASRTISRSFSGFLFYLICVLAINLSVPTTVAWVPTSFILPAALRLWQSAAASDKWRSAQATTSTSRCHTVISSSRMDTDDALMEAAAVVTQQSCQLLGVKSVGVDYGLVRTGLATTVGYDPKPLTILSDLNTTEVCQQVIQYCISEQASQIIVGLPLHKNGTEAEQTNITRMFAQELTRMALQTLGPNVPVYMWDERYTSKYAAARAHSQHSDQRESLYGTLDADAACIILEHFYTKNGKGAHPVRLLSQEMELECLQKWEETQQKEQQAKMAAKELRLGGGRSNQRQESMERARQLEAEMEKQGILGVSRKKKKKTKKKRAKRGPWLTPGDAM